MANLRENKGLNNNIGKYKIDKFDRIFEMRGGLY